jgi:dihydrolipoamide dehydrogenase
MSNEINAEVVVIGSGPGGYSAAFRAADLGKKVVLIERYEILGGVCLNVGCIPSKALLHAAKVIDDAHAMAANGIEFGKPKIDISKLRDWKNKVVNKLTGGLKMLAKTRKVEVIQGSAKFTSKNTLEVEGKNGKQSIKFDNAIIAVGSRVVKLPFLPDDPRIIDSTGALELKDTSGKMLVIGGGIIGLEMATVYEALGSEITIVELMDQIIPGCDKDVVTPLFKRITARYKNIYLKTKVTKVEAKKEGLYVTFEGENAPAKPEKFDRILSAVGRRPNGDQIAADKAGVKVDERGFIPSDKQLRTNVSNIYSIGDVRGMPMLAHKAIPEGRTAAEIISGSKHNFDPACIPSVAYTDPEVAWVGITESMTKILVDETTHRVIGGATVGPNAGELIAELGLAIEMGCDIEDVSLTIHPHPTLSETVAMAAEVFEGTITDLYLPKKKTEKPEAVTK